MEILEKLAESCKQAVKELKDIKMKAQAAKEEATHLLSQKADIVAELNPLKEELASIKNKILTEKSLVIQEIDKKKDEVNQLEGKLKDSLATAEAKAKILQQDIEKYKKMYDDAVSLKAEANKLISEYKEKVDKVNKMLLN